VGLCSSDNQLAGKRVAVYLVILQLANQANRLPYFFEGMLEDPRLFDTVRACLDDLSAGGTGAGTHVGSPAATTVTPLSAGLAGRPLKDAWELVAVPYITLNSCLHARLWLPLPDRQHVLPHLDEVRRTGINEQSFFATHVKPTAALDCLLPDIPCAFPTDPALWGEF